MDFRPLNNATLNPTIFSPDLNIKSSEGPWIATFAAPEGTVLDTLTFPITLYNGATNSTDEGKPQGSNASTTLKATLTLLSGETEVETLEQTFNVTGTGNFTTPAKTLTFAFPPQAITAFRLAMVQTSDDGMNAGLLSFSAGRYLYSATATLAFSGKTSAGATVGEAGSTASWTLSQPSGQTFMTTASGAISGDGTILTPNVNVGSDNTWALTFTPAESRWLSGVGFNVVMFSSSGGAQNSSTVRTVQFTAEALDGEGNVLVTASTASDLLLTGSGNKTTATNGAIALDFSEAVEAVSLRISARRGTNTANSAYTNGCYYGLSAVQWVDKRVPEAVTEAPGAAAPTAVWVNPAAWPAEARAVGAVYLGADYACPEVAVGQGTVQAEVVRCEATALTLTVAEAVEAATCLTASTYLGPDTLTATLAGEPALEGSLRPGQQRRVARLTGVGSAEEVFALGVETERFRTDPAQAVLYLTGAETREDFASAQWWHSASAGVDAEQGALPAEAEPMIWLEAGATVVLGAGVERLAFVEEEQSGFVEIPAGVALTFAAPIAPAVSNPLFPDGVAVKLAGALTMAGTLPAVQVSGATATLGSPGDLTVQSLSAAEGAGPLTIASGAVTVMAPPALSMVLAGGSLALAGSEAVDVPEIAVRAPGALTLGEAISVARLSVAADSRVAIDPASMEQVAAWAGEGQVLVATESEVSVQVAVEESATVTFGVANGTEAARGWWVTLDAGTLTVGKVSSDAGSGTAEDTALSEALFEKVLASGPAIPEGTKRLTYVAKNTGGTQTGSAEEALHAAAVFDLVPKSIGTPDGEGVAVATVVYDFGVEGLTVKSVEGVLYVVLTVAVQAEAGGGGADFADGTTVAVKAFDPSGAEIASGPVEVDEAFAPFAEDAGGSGPVRYFRMPLADLPTGGTTFRAYAEKP